MCGRVCKNVVVIGANALLFQKTGSLSCVDKDKGKKKKTKTPSLPRPLLPARGHPECEELGIEELQRERERDLVQLGKGEAAEFFSNGRLIRKLPGGRCVPLKRQIVLSKVFAQLQQVRERRFTVAKILWIP